MNKDLATIDPRVTIFVAGMLCAVVLGGMALGYEVSFSVFDGTLRVSKPDSDVGAAERLALTP